MANKIDRRQMLLGTAALGTTPLWMSNLAFAQSGDTLYMRMLEEMKAFDPPFSVGESDTWVIKTVHSGLIDNKTGNEWDWELLLAESIEQTDETTVTFKLREGLQWSNGYGEVTAEDVKYSYERYRDEDLAAPNAVSWAPLDHVEVTGTYTGIIHLKESFSGLFSYLLPRDPGSIICKKAWEEAGGAPGLEVPAGHGPYQIVEYRPGDRIIFEPSPVWSGEEPAFKRVEMLPITDTKAAENAVLSGDLDWAIVSISAVPSMQEGLPDNLALDIRSTPNFIWIGSNMNNPDLADERVRKAIHMAIDRETVLEGAYFGVMEPSYGVAARGAPGYMENPPVERDVEGAKALLEEAGATGLSLRLDVPAEPDKVTAAQIVQANLAEVGINVSINQHEAGAFWGLPETLGQDLQLFFTEWTLVPPDMNWVTQWWLPEQAGVWNWQYLQDDEMKRLHFESASEIDPEKRGELLKQLQTVVDESYTCFMLGHLPRPVLYDKTKVVPAMLPNAEPRTEKFKKA
ncbi:ABC transporter substrate-binding protein [Roseovarius indicus]|uniref:ABC transporter substrate-binding protein n=1 Tax=Roseovarius indicus TaxID=540747 RepID=UPI0007D8E5E8|nr:ABC transporter substrate-binding protein [Roseovarius indicus]OAN98206.1 hypothetical protein A8B76_19655 [Roseovarius indicus]